MAIKFSPRFRRVALRIHPYRWQTATTFVVALTVQLGIGVHARADDPHPGIIEYEIACMPCYGVDGRGAGRRASSLKIIPADLTKIAKSNKGEFPSRKVTGIIDGREIVTVHGPREMPVRGDRYRAPTESYETPVQIEQRARANYLKTIQEK